MAVPNAGRPASLPAPRVGSASALLALCAGHRLTGREVEVVVLLADGFTNKEIAQRMVVSVNTVKAFIRGVMLKIGVSTRAGIIGRLFNESLLRQTQ